jgi:hypothetical protein
MVIVMPVHQATFDRLRAAKISGDGLATILEQMAAGIEMLGAATSQLQLDWQQPDDELREDDLLPVVTLSLRPALPEETR